MHTKSKLTSVLSGLAVVSLVALATSGCQPSSENGGGASGMEAEARALETARQKDAAWKPSHEEIAVIQVGEKGKGGSLHNFCLNLDGNVLACWGGKPSRSRVTGESASARRTEVKDTDQIKVFSPDGKLLKQWTLEAMPQALCVHRDGSIFVGGGGRLFKLNQEGKVLASADSPGVGKKVALSKATVESLRQSRSMSEQEMTRYTQMLEQRKSEITGIAVTDQDLFVVCPSASDFSYTVYRLGHDLKHPALVVEGLRGCCGQMDLQAKEGKLWIPHNARHRVECRDRDGKELSAFGKRDRKAADGFGGCCEPKNLRLAANGDIYTTESGPPVAVKRFSKDGKFLGVIALPQFKSDCVRVTVEVSQDGKRCFILNTSDDAIHVLAQKS